MKKIAIFFPGIGYHCDKPLLYYSRKIVVENGYTECMNLDYKYDGKGIRELYMDKVKGLICASDYSVMSKDFVDDRDRLERLIADSRRRIGELDVKIDVGDNRKEIIEQYTNLEHLNREMVEILIDYISVGKRIKGTTDVPIEIHWNF